MHSSRATLLLAALAAAAPQAAPKSAAASPYPIESPTRALRWYAIEGEIGRGELEALLAELDVRLLDGPSGSSCRPKVFALAVDAPVELQGRALERALRKEKLDVEPLFATCFAGGDGETPTLPSLGVGLSTQDAILGMASEIRWHVNRDGFVQFWTTSTKLEAGEIASRYEKLFKPFGGSHLGEPVRDSLRWRLPEEAETKRVEKLLKRVRRLPGVVSAEWIEEEKTLALELVLEGLELSLPAEGGSPPRPRWFTGPLLELLEKESLAPVEALPEPADASGDDGG
jgi:hypothetical protein